MMTILTTMHNRGKNEYNTLEGPGNNTNTDIQEGEHMYHVLQYTEGPGNNSDTNTDVQEGEHKYQ